MGNTERKSLSLYDVEAETAVRIDWPPGGGAEAQVRFRPAGGAAVSLPASVVELAAALLRDPSLLETAARG